MGSQEERAEGRGRGWALQQSNEEANRLTRECLRIAVLQLSGSKSFDAMTVTEVAKRAGVSRTAFYRNYDSMEELAALVEDVTGEEVSAAARLLECDMVYFMTRDGEDAEDA